LLSEFQRDRLCVVLVSPRNPLNIGAAARAMANFGFSRLTVVAPYQPHWREAKSAVGAEDLLSIARKTETLADAVADCSLVLGTATLTRRKPEQPVVPLPLLAPFIREKEKNGRVALVFGPEKRGLTREDLSFCHYLVEIPTHPSQPSMNLAQAVAVCLYELSIRVSAPRVASESGAPGPKSPTTGLRRWGSDPSSLGTGVSGPDVSKTFSEAREIATTADLDLLTSVIEQTLIAANYSPAAMQKANRHDLHLMLRRLAPKRPDARRILGMFRRILVALQRHTGPH
jgi:TrmH family RNA methyltransferase